MPLSRRQIAWRAAQDLADGVYVNLGIGLPTMVADVLPEGREIVLQSENGVLGVGPAPGANEIDLDLVNAGKQPETALPGASFFHHADSFAMMRGGHLDFCVLGAFQVSVAGDLANWHTGAPAAGRLRAACSHASSGIGCAGSAIKVATWVMWCETADECVGRNSRRFRLRRAR